VFQDWGNAVPAIIREIDGKWVVKSHRGKGAKTLGTHTSRDKALKQQRAVNVSLHKKGKIK
jgi:hypothetical protein